MNAAVQYAYKRRTVAPGLYESGILPGESEDSPGVYLPTKAGRLAPRQTPDVFFTHLSIRYQLRLPQRHSSKINTLINRGYIHHFRHERLSPNTRKSL